MDFISPSFCAKATSIISPGPCLYCLLTVKCCVEELAVLFPSGHDGERQGSPEHNSSQQAELLTQLEHKEEVSGRWRMVGQTRKNEEALSGIAQIELGRSEFT